MIGEPGRPYTGRAHSSIAPEYIAQPGAGQPVRGHLRVPLWPADQVSSRDTRSFIGVAGSVAGRLSAPSRPDHDEGPDTGSGQVEGEPVTVAHRCDVFASQLVRRLTMVGPAVPLAGRAGRREEDSREGRLNGSDIIRVENLTKRYGDLVAVDSVSFTVRQGEVFGILGPNGAGKTTTVEILEGMRVPDGGTVIVAGIDVVRDPRRVKASIGVQLQSTDFFDGLYLGELLGVFGSLYRTRVDALALLQMVELAEKARSRFKQLSGGQKQRFSIAVALVNDPPLLFLDEPTAGLDPQARRHLWELVKRLQSEGKTVVMTTHYMDEAEELCDRVAIMDNGSILRMDSPDALISEMVAKGFHKDQPIKLANLEDVFIDLTGRMLRGG